MALFGGNKKLCPICGNPAAKLLPTKVEGQPLCSDCAGKASVLADNLRGSTLSNMGAFRSYLADYDANQALRNTFRESYRRQFGFLGGAFALDVSNRLLRLDASNDNSFVLEPSNIRRFRILEDGTPLFEGTKDGLICYQSAIPDKVRNLGPEIERLQIEKMHCEEMERREEMLEEQAKQRGESYTKRYIPTPDINKLRPLDKFYLLIEVDHPYSKAQAEFKEEGPYFSGPDFFGGYSSAVKEYLRNYELKAGEMRELATQIMAVLNPNAPEHQAGIGTVSGIQTVSSIQTVSIAPTVQVDPVAEIQKYKALLDSGAITEEEFAAKKRQLMDI